MKVPRGFSSRFFQSEFLPSFFFLFFSSSPGNEFLSRHHAARSWLEEHESSFERSFANSDHAISLDNHEFPFRRQNAARSSFFFLSIGLLSHCNFPTRFLRSKFLSDSRDSRDFHRWIIAFSTGNIARAYNLKSFHHASKYTRWLRFIRVARIVFHVVWSVESGWLGVNSAS